MVGSQAGGHTGTYQIYTTPEESNLRSSGLLANVAPLYHLLLAKILPENLGLTTMSLNLRHADKANTLTDDCAGQLNRSTHAALGQPIDLERTDTQPGWPALLVGSSTHCCLITPHPVIAHCNSVKVRYVYEKKYEAAKPTSVTVIRRVVALGARPTCSNPKKIVGGCFLTERSSAPRPDGHFPTGQ